MSCQSSITAPPAKVAACALRSCPPSKCESARVPPLWYSKKFPKVGRSAKACNIFETLKVRKDKELTETFMASHGWFRWFSWWFHLCNQSISGVAARMDIEACGKWSHQQRWLRSETDLQFGWNHTFLPKRFYIRKEKTKKASKYRVKLWVQAKAFLRVLPWKPSCIEAG